MRVWVNDELLDRPEIPAISVADHGFTVGDGVFEAIKVVRGRPFALEEHLARLTRSAEGLGLPTPDLDRIKAGIAATVAGQDLALGRIRVTYTAGIAPMGSGRGNQGTTLVVAAGPMDPWPETTTVVVAPWPRNERGATAGLKTTSYAENVIALAYAQERGATEAIFGNLAGNVCEGTGTNVFYVVGGEVRTPTLDSGCLGGITRQLVLDWYGGVEVDEPLAVLEDAEEVFLASTTRDVQGVTRIDGHFYPAPGPVTREVMKTWAERESAALAQP
ncbi:MAG: aminodeoxychorismate lyase [Nocardioidaceae bacterium]